MCPIVNTTPGESAMSFNRLGTMLVVPTSSGKNNCNVRKEKGQNGIRTHPLRSETATSIPCLQSIHRLKPLRHVATSFVWLIYDRGLPFANV